MVSKSVDRIERVGQRGGRRRVYGLRCFRGNWLGELLPCQPLDDRVLITTLLFKHLGRADTVPRAESPDIFHKPDVTEPQSAEPVDCAIKSLWRLTLNMCEPEDGHPSVSITQHKPASGLTVLRCSSHCVRKPRWTTYLL